jgi:AcrR family transcriptional regulator
MPLPRHLQPRKEPQQARSRDLVEAVVEACARVLVARGFADMNVAEVAEVAGVSVGSLYQYFPHKEALVVAVVERQSAREVVHLAGCFQELSASSAEELLGAMVDAVLSFRAQDPALQDALLDAIPLVGRYYDLRARGAAAAKMLRALMEPHFVQLEGGPNLDELVFVCGNATHALTHEGLLRRPAGMSDAHLATEIKRLLGAYLQALRPQPDR